MLLKVRTGTERTEYIKHDLVSYIKLKLNNTFSIMNIKDGSVVWLIFWSINKYSNKAYHHINWHEDSFFLLTIGLDLVFMTVLIASSKTYFSPTWLKALHSIYLHWNSSSMIFLAVYFWIGAYLGSFLMAAYSYLKSVLLPTNILGTFPTFSCN